MPIFLPLTDVIGSISLVAEVSNISSAFINSLTLKFFRWNNISSSKHNFSIIFILTPSSKLLQGSGQKTFLVSLSKSLKLLPQ